MPAGGSVIYVHVLGQVAHPVCTRSATATGGSTSSPRRADSPQTADPAGINLARFLTDGEQIVVPAVGRGAWRAPGGAGDGMVNLNTADAAALDTLPRIGPALAQRIIAWREKNGPLRVGRGPARRARDRRRDPRGAARPRHDVSVGFVGARDLRLVPPAVLAWLGRGARDRRSRRRAAPRDRRRSALWAAAIAALAAARSCDGTAVARHDRRRPGRPRAGGDRGGRPRRDRREPGVVLAAAEGGRSSPVAIAVTGRPVDGRVEGTHPRASATSAVCRAPSCCSACPTIRSVADARIGEVIAVTGGRAARRPRRGRGVPGLRARPGGVAHRTARPCWARPATSAHPSAELATGLPGPGAGLLPGPRDRRHRRGDPRARRRDEGRVR